MSTLDEVPRAVLSSNVSGVNKVQQFSLEKDTFFDSTGKHSSHLCFVTFQTSQLTINSMPIVQSQVTSFPKNIVTVLNLRFACLSKVTRLTVYHHYLMRFSYLGFRPLGNGTYMKIFALSEEVSL